MNDLTIETHNFEKSKNQLKKFAKETTTNLDLQKINSNKAAGEWFTGFLLGDGISLTHKVTGGELNDLTSQIQNHLVAINNTQRNFIKEFGEVYNALEALDKDYIQSILIAIKAAQKANDEAIDAQKDLSKTIDTQKDTLKVLQQFKQRIDKFAHLEDIDIMWKEISNYQEYMETLSQLVEQIDTVNNSLNSQLEVINQLRDNDKELFSNNIEIKNKNEELIKKINACSQEINECQESLDSIKEIYDGNVVEIKELQNTLSDYSNSIDDLIKFRNTIESFDHINDIDEMHDSIMTLNNRVDSVKSNNTLCQEELSKQKNTIDNLDIKLDDLNSKNISSITDNSSKLKRLSYVTYGLIIIIVIQFILIVSGIL